MIRNSLYGFFQGFVYPRQLEVDDDLVGVCRYESPFVAFDRLSKSGEYSLSSSPSIFY